MMGTIDTEDWEQLVAFIRLEFPAAQRDTAQQLAVVFAGLVGRVITSLRPEHTVQQLASSAGGDSLDAREFVAGFLEQQGKSSDIHRFEEWTFRELVEYVNARSP